MSESPERASAAPGPVGPAAQAGAAAMLSEGTRDPAGAHVPDPARRADRL